MLAVLGKKWPGKQVKLVLMGGGYAFWLIFGGQLLIGTPKLFFSTNLRQK